MILVGLSSYEDNRCPHMRTNRGRIDTSDCDRNDTKQIENRQDMCTSKRRQSLVKAR